MLPMVVSLVVGLASFVFVVVVFLAVDRLVAPWRHKSLRGLLKVMAAEVGGKVAGGDWRGPLRLEFTLAGAPARLRYLQQGRYGDIKHTELVLEQPRGVLADLHLYPERTLGRLARALGAQDVQVGDPLFDAAFMIKAKPPEAAHRALGEQVRLALMELLNLGGSDQLDLYVSRRQGLVRLRKKNWLESSDLVERFLDLGGTVLTGVARALGGRLSPRPEESIGTEPASKPALPDCPVCLMAVEEQPIFCRRCGTPHHPECWQLNDGCGACQPGEQVRLPG